MKPLKYANYVMIETKKVEIYKSIRVRLVNEIGMVLNLIEDYNENPNYPSRATIGYWSGVRMLMPIVESLANLIPSKKPSEFLEHNLNFKGFGSLVWEMFRHPLIHGDMPYTLEFKGKKVIWSLHFSNLKQSIIKASGNHPTRIVLCVMQLYDDLLNYIDLEIAKNDQALINFPIGLRYNEKSRKEILKEFSYV